MKKIRLIYVFLYATLISTTMYLLQNLVLYALLVMNHEGQLNALIPELTIYPITMLVYIVMLGLCHKYSADSEDIGFRQNVQFMAILLLLFLIPKVVNLPFVIRTIVVLLSIENYSFDINSMGRIILDLIFTFIRFLIVVLLMISDKKMTADISDEFKDRT